MSSLEAATRNVLATLAVAGAAVPVHAGAAQPLAQDWIHAHHVHGEDGLGGAPRPARTAEVAGSDAVGFLVSTLSAAAASADRVDLLMIGPLTNLALALQRAPGITGGIGRLTIMGGTVHGRGNVTPAAEFNIFSDPEAAAIVFAAAIDTTVVPWESCLAHALSGAEIDRMFEPVIASDYKAFAQALVAARPEKAHPQRPGRLPLLHRSAGRRRRRRARHGDEIAARVPRRLLSRRASPAA